MTEKNLHMPDLGGSVFNNCKLAGSLDNILLLFSRVDKTIFYLHDCLLPLGP